MDAPSLPTRVARILALTRAEPLAISVGIGVLPLLHRAKRRGRMRTAQRIERLLAGGSPSPADRDGPADPVAESRRVGQAVAVGARLWGLSSSSCLARSSISHALLTRRGIAATIRVGMASDRTTAHAWVEVDGVPIDDTADVVERYLVFDQDLVGPGPDTPPG